MAVELLSTEEVWDRDTSPFINNLNTEQQADQLIRWGAFSDAQKILDEGIHDPASSVVRAGRLLLKRCTLPLLELDWRNNNRTATDPELVASAESVHSELGILMEIGLDYIRHASWRYSRDSKKNMIGIVSEATLLAVGARYFNQTGESYIIPGTYDEDRNGGAFATDMRLVHADRHQPTRRIQAKTTRIDDHSEKYNHRVAVIGVNDLDPTGYTRHRNPNSIYRTIIRELEGGSTEEDIELLDGAMDTIFKLTATEPN